MNRYYIVFESQSKKYWVIRDTSWDMNTYKGLLNVIKELKNEKACDVLIHSWRLLN